MIEIEKEVSEKIYIVIADFLDKIHDALIKEDRISLDYYISRYQRYRETYEVYSMEDVRGNTEK